jgi:Probable Zinc-ribbon domain
MVKKFFWICSSPKNSCGCHKWETTPNHRTSSKSGCPYCRGRKLCVHNNFLTLYPKLCEEWDYEKNNLRPENCSPFSNKRIFWICPVNPCGCHKWDATISHRSGSEQSGCPYCSNNRICPHKNLLISCPELCKNEWDYEKNKLGPENYARTCGKKVWWKCEKGHSWQCTIYNRSKEKLTACPICSHNTFSKKQIDWLNKIAKKYNIEIQNAKSPNGEYQVTINNKVFKIDGFVMINNKKIIFEFDGCFWHGCENCFDPTKKNRVNKKTYKELQDTTKEKKISLENAGYIVISIKECEYDKNEDFCEYDDILL